MRNVFYFKDINAIGGVESFFYYLSCLYKNMVVYYKQADPKQIERLAKNIECNKYKTGEKIKCDKFFCCYNPDIIDYVDAKEYIQIIHCDYKSVDFKPIIHPKFTKYIGVSKLACDSFEELTGIKPELIYNPVVVKNHNVEKYNDGKIHILCATRLTKEKGGENIVKLAQLSDDFVIDLYSNRRLFPELPNIIKHDPKLDLSEDIAKSHYVAQLSKHEAFGYTPVESLTIGTPVIVTDLPVFKELGIKHGENAIVCDYNMKNLDIDMIKKGLPDFTYTPPKSEWDRYLDNNTKYNPNKKVEVRAKISYTDTYLNRKVQINEEFKIPIWRAKMLEVTPRRIGIVGLVEIL